MNESLLFTCRTNLEAYASKFVCASPLERGETMENIGFEPMTYGLQSRRSTN